MQTWLKVSKSIASVTAIAGALLVAPAIIDRGVSEVGVVNGIGASVIAAPEKAALKRRLPGISEKVFKGLGKVSAKAQPDIDKYPDRKPDWKGAFKELKALEKKCATCNGYEKSQVYQMYAYVAYSMEKYKDAVGYYKKVVEQSPEIPIGVELQSLMYIAQLSFQLENYDDSINYLDAWMKLAKDTNNTIGPEILQLKSVICYQDDRKKCAFDNIKTAVEMVEARGKVAEESWYNLLRSMYLEKENYKVATQILEKMIRHYPKKTYWAQLGSMYGLIEREGDQLYAMDAAYLMGALYKEKDIVNLSYLFLGEQVPYRSATLLAKGMKDKVIERTERNLETLAVAWQQAKEPGKAIPVLLEVGKMAKSGNHYGQLTGVYLDLKRPKDAIEIGKKALKKGKFTRGIDGEVHINMGIAYFDLKQYTNAIESFEKASKIKKHAKFARGWLRYAQNEKARYLGLKDALASLGLDIEKVINK